MSKICMCRGKDPNFCPDPATGWQEIIDNVINKTLSNSQEPSFVQYQILRPYTFTRPQLLINRTPFSGCASS